MNDSYTIRFANPDGTVTEIKRTDPPKLIRMTGAPGTTEYNDRNGLFSADSRDGKFYLPADSIPEAIKVGFRPAPLSRAERWALVHDAVADLDDADLTADALARIVSFEVAKRAARQAAKAPA
jgi:hypothetical protein